MDISSQKIKAKELRADIIRMIYIAQSGHPGGSLSCVEMLMALYYNTLNIDPKNPWWEERDRVVLSKGHGCPALYAILADLGYFPREELWSLRKIDSHLQGHPDMCKTPGIDVNTGSLGHGVSIAVGMALAAKHMKKKYKIYTVVGDGELQEGLVWEAAMSASHYKLDNLTIMLDHNGLQLDGPVDTIMSLGNISQKFKSFGFECYTVDGHDIQAIVDAIYSPHNGKPKFICCETHKGYGISFMLDQVGWHGKAPNSDEYVEAMGELGVAVE